MANVIIRTAAVIIKSGPLSPYESAAPTESPSPDTPTKSGPTLSPASRANYGCDSTANCHHKVFLKYCVSWSDRSVAVH